MKDELERIQDQIKTLSEVNAVQADRLEAQANLVETLAALLRGILDGHGLQPDQLAQADLLTRTVLGTGQPVEAPQAGDFSSGERIAGGPVGVIGKPPN